MKRMLFCLTKLTCGYLIFLSEEKGGKGGRSFNAIALVSL